MADVYPITSFCMSIEFLLLIYTVIPLPLYLCIIFGTTYSVIYEILATTFLCIGGPWDIVGKVLLHLCIHLIGIQVFIMSQVWMKKDTSAMPARGVWEGGSGGSSSPP